MRRPTSASMATTEKPKRARERPMLAVVVVFPTPPLPEVMTVTRGVVPESSGFRFHWRRAEGGRGLGVRVLEGWRGRGLGKRVAPGRMWSGGIGKKKIKKKKKKKKKKKMMNKRISVRVSEGTLRIEKWRMRRRWLMLWVWG